MEQSPRLSLSYVMPAQAQKHVTVNETFRRLDQLVQQSVLSRTLAAEPAAPNEGDAYILTATPTGASWSAYAQNNIAAFQDGAWMEIAASEGFSAWVADADEFVIYDGALWNPVSGGSSETAAKFGVNTTADATNKFAVKSNAVLFDALDAAESGTGDSQVKINKEAVGDTGSIIFQTGFSGRAEFGLTGDDDFHVKVSPDGSSWTDAIFIDKDNGNIGFFTSDAKAPFSMHSDGTTLPTISAGTTFYLARTGSPSSFTNISLISGNTSVCTINFGDTDLENVGFLQYNHASNYLRVITSSVERFRITAGVEVGSPTGGDKGAGTINAQAVYDDNTLLTCYVFDQALDGAIDELKWDGKVPNRRIPEKSETDPETNEKRILSEAGTELRLHQPMRKFRARMGTAHDPLTLDGYAKHWREKRHLTSMPNEAAFDPENGQLTTGEWIQRLVETVEIQAVLIEELNGRLKALETAPGL